MSAFHFFGGPRQFVRELHAANKEAPSSSCPYPILSRSCAELVEKAALGGNIIGRHCGLRERRANKQVMQEVRCHS